jgi:allantoinase
MKLQRLLIKNGNVYTNGTLKCLSIVIINGIIEELVQAEETIDEKDFNVIIDARGSVVLPGFIDAHVHFNDPGREEWEGFMTGSTAAAAGGITTVFDMPLNSSPSAVTSDLIRAKQTHLQTRSVIDYRLWGGITADNVENVEELKKMKEQGIVGFKAFLSNSGIDDFPAITKKQLKQAMVAAKELNTILALHAEDEELIAKKTKQLLEAGQSDRYAFLESRPPEAEYFAIEHVLQLAEETGADIHLVHVSCPDAIQLISQYKQQGVKVTIEVCPHYLLFTDHDFVREGPILKCAPPLRSDRTVEKLWNFLKLGMIDTIGTDHSPCPLEMKTVGNDVIWKAWGGVQGVQFAFPYLLDTALERGFTINDIIPLCTSNVAKRFGLTRKTGLIEVGHEADITIYKLGEKNRVNKSDILTKNAYSPYEGLEANGVILATIVRGQLVYEKNGNPKYSLFGYGKETD